MKSKHIGSSFLDDVREWKKKPSFRQAVEEHKEKVKMAMLLKQVRQKEALSQTQLAKKAHVSQSVIARIESCTSKTLPRLDLFNKILNSIGYKTIFVASKNKKSVQIAF